MLWSGHFHFLAPIYDRVITHVQPERLKTLLQLPAEVTLLDIGGGTGRVAQTLAAHVGQVIVLDESLGMLREARSKGLPAVCAQAERLPLPDNAIPRLLMVDAFHHLTNHAGAVTEMMRIVSPQGRLVIEEPNIRRGWVKVVAMAEKLALMRSRFFSPEKMGQMFEAAGGQVTQVHDGTNFWLIVEVPA
jgi:demethylmenaquinone methyltransferase/2-methoxy-6-polyprenyl-1,4-benzoquinol methylase